MLGLVELDHDVLHWHADADAARAADDGDAGDRRAALDARGKEKDRVALSALPLGC